MTIGHLVTIISTILCKLANNIVLQIQVHSHSDLHINSSNRSTDLFFFLFMSNTSEIIDVLSTLIIKQKLVY